MVENKTIRRSPSPLIYQGSTRDLNGSRQLTSNFRSKRGSLDNIDNEDEETKQFKEIE
jgi:hypothetical protein